MPSREAVIAEALTWLGTPFRHNQQVKGAGCDCALFPLAVYRAAGFDMDVLVPHYSFQWHLHRSEELYLNTIQKVLAKVGGREITEPLPGDFVVFRIGRTYSHGGIVIKWPEIIHAYARSLIVELHDVVRSDLTRIPHKFFTPWSAS